MFMVYFYWSSEVDYEKKVESLSQEQGLEILEMFKEASKEQEK